MIRLQYNSGQWSRIRVFRGPWSALDLAGLCLALNAGATDLVIPLNMCFDNQFYCRKYCLLLNRNHLNCNVTVVYKHHVTDMTISWYSEIQRPVSYRKQNQRK